MLFCSYVPAVSSGLCDECGRLAKWAGSSADDCHFESKRALLACGGALAGHKIGSIGGTSGGRRRKLPGPKLVLSCSECVANKRESYFFLMVAGTDFSCHRTL